LRALTPATPSLLRYRSSITSSDFHCPFCEKTSPRPQGLAAHIRNRHTKQYPKWLKLLTRLVDAQKISAAQESIEPPAPEPSAAPLPSPTPAPSPLPAGANPALDFLKKAHAELVSRKASIEAALAQMSDLTKELETVKTPQIQALDKTLAVFEPPHE
jgi:hypothetical protein